MHQQRLGISPQHLVSGAALAIMRHIDELNLEHPFMGAHVLRGKLHRERFNAGRRHIGMLMQRMGVAALALLPGTSESAPGHKIYPYPLRDLAITRPNYVWALHMTYTPMASNFVYLPAVVNVFTRGVLAHRFAITLGPSTPKR